MEKSNTAILNYVSLGITHRWQTLIIKVQKMVTSGMEEHVVGLGTWGLPDTDNVLFLNMGSGYRVILLYFFVIIF